MQSASTRPLVSLVYSLYVMLALSRVTIRLSSLELWLLLEIVTFVFIGLSLLGFIQYGAFSQGLLSYFLIQSGLSILLLFSLLNLLSGIGVYVYLVYFAVIGKLGVLPMGVWVYPVFRQLRGSALFNAMTFQKLPLFILLFGVTSLATPVTLLLVASLVTGGIMALSSANLTSLLVLRSISNNTWLWLSLWGPRVYGFLAFYVVYRLGLYLSIFPPQGSLQALGVLSLSGLPPFPLFFVKLGVVYLVLESRIRPYPLTLALLLLVSTFLISSSYVRYVSLGITNQLGLLLYVSQDSPFN